MLRIERAGDLQRKLIEVARANHNLAGRPGLGLKPLHQCIAILPDFIGFFAKQPRDFAEYVDKRCAAIA